MMMVHTDQADPKYKHSCITCRSCVQLTLDIYGVDARVYTKILKTTHILLVHLTALENGINPDIGTIKKDRGDIFSE